MPNLARAIADACDHRDCDGDLAQAPLTGSFLFPPVWNDPVISASLCPPDKHNSRGT